MKKIMFNDRYGLTQAVLEGSKTMTRRIIPDDLQVMVEIASKPILIVPLACIPNGLSIEEFAEQFSQAAEKTKVIHVRNEEKIEYVDASADIYKYAQYHIGEEVAIAQSYKNLGYPPNTIQRGRCVRRSRYLDYWDDSMRGQLGDWFIEQLAGWENKMFVHPEMCNHHICIKDIKIERLQDISSEDCLREGVLKNGGWRPYNFALRGFSEWFETPQKAFATLIDKISGRGTWDRNPWVFAYTFELVK